VIFLEEPSAREMLKGLLPRLLPEGPIPRYVVFEGKQDLEKGLPGKLRGWKAPDTLFVLANPVQELQRLTGNRYRKVSGSRDIGPHLSLVSNASQSFSVFLSGIRNMLGLE